MVRRLAALLLQGRQRHRKVPSDDAQQAFRPRAELARLLGLEVENTRELIANDQWNGSRALRSSESGERDLISRRLGAALLKRPLDSGSHRTPSRDIRDTHHGATLGGNSDHSNAESYLGAGRRACVPVARDGKEPVGCLVSDQENRLAKPEQVLERLETRARGRGVVGSVRESPHELVKGAEPIPRLPATSVDSGDLSRSDAVDHAVDVYSTQPEHVGHAGLRRDSVEARPRAFERRSLCLGVKKLEIECELVHRVRVHDRYMRVRVGLEVGGCGRFPA